MNNDNTNTSLNGEYIHVANSSGYTTITAKKSGKYAYAVSGSTTFTVVEKQANETIYAGSFESHMIGIVVIAL